MSDRPFQVLGLQQIAVGGLDKGALRRFWIDIMGLTPTGTYRSEKENVDEDIAVAGSGPFKVEVVLMQPIDPEKKPKVHVDAVPTKKEEEQHRRTGGELKPEHYTALAAEASSSSARTSASSCSIVCSNSLSAIGISPINSVLFYL